MSVTIAGKLIVDRLIVAARRTVDIDVRVNHMPLHLIAVLAVSCTTLGGWSLLQGNVVLRRLFALRAQRGGTDKCSDATL